MFASSAASYLELTLQFPWGTHVSREYLKRKELLCGKVVCCWRGERVPVISQGGTWFTECLKRKVIEVEPGLKDLLN